MRAPDLESGYTFVICLLYFQLLSSCRTQVFPLVCGDC